MIKDQSIFPWVITLSILIALPLDYVLILLVEIILMKVTLRAWKVNILIRATLSITNNSLKKAEFFFVYTVSKIDLISFFITKHKTGTIINIHFIQVKLSKVLKQGYFYLPDFSKRKKILGVVCSCHWVIKLVTLIIFWLLTQSKTLKYFCCFLMPQIQEKIFLISNCKT